MNYFLSFILVLLLQGCQQATPNEIDPSVVESAVSDLQQVLETIHIGETTTDMLTEFTKLDDQNYEKAPITLTVKNGLVDSVTLTIQEALTLDDVLRDEINAPSHYKMEWIRADERTNAVRFTLSEPSLQQQIAAIPLDEKIGQLVLTGFDGTTITPLLTQAIEDAHIGHVILFSKNIQNAAQLKALNTSLLQLKTAHPLWISIDEEGGLVSRIPDDFVTLPSAARLTTYRPEHVQQLAKLQGELLHAYGFSVNFAPVLDVNSNPTNPVIGNRAFSSHVATVNSYATAFTNGLRESDIIGAGKHFPGHGDTATDSHVALPVIHKSLEQLKKTELVPFQHAIDQGIDMIMVGHLLVPALDDKEPATTSPKLMQDLLRAEMGFDGVIITDDLTMQAIDTPVPQAAVQAIVAGADIALIGHGTEQAIAATKAIAKAVADKQLSERQLNERVFRILSLKQHYSGDVNETFHKEQWNTRMKQVLD